MNKSWIRTRNDDWIANIAWGLGILALALAATLARRWGYIDAETVRRLVIGANGLMIAWNGNRMPKMFVPSACARRIRRVGGWSMTLSGLFYAGLWAFAPLPAAMAWGTTAVVAGIAVTVGYGFLLRSRAKAA